jgi:L-cysteine/cystine lyase
MRVLPHVRRQRVVPALELPHHCRVATVSVLREACVTPAEARKRFPVLDRVAYMNAGSVGPLATRTFEVMREVEESGLTRGRGAMSGFQASMDRGVRLRNAIARFIHVSAENVVLTTSTTEGCNIVVTGLGLSPDDEVVTTDAEHPGLSAPLQASGARIRKARVIGRPASEALQAVLDEVTPRTTLIALSHVLWLNGHVLPLAEIKHRTGLPVLVDGAQSVGAIPVDASVVDYYTVSGQKWLCGPETTGALYVADHTTLRPRMAAYASTTMQDASRLSVTHLAQPLVAGLLCAVEDVPEWGFDRAAAMVALCRQALIDAGAELRTDAGQGTLISFRVPGEPAEVVNRAEAAGVVIRHLPDGWLRASVGWWNDEADVDRLAAFVRALRSAG